uniref:PH-15 domain-containing protein n=1 Tax=Acrobeloides nanus TaxID=290746 RepID=A0A914C1Y1_9BILA
MFQWLSFRRRFRTYSTLPDKEETMSWGEALYGFIEKRSFPHRWHNRFSVLNRSGFFIIYKTKHTGRVYDLKLTKKFCFRHSIKATFFKLEFEDGETIRLRLRDETALLWAEKFIRILLKDSTNRSDYRAMNVSPISYRRIAVKRKQSSISSSNLSSDSLTESSFITAADTSHGCNESTLHNSVLNANEDEIIASNLEFSGAYIGTTENASLKSYNEWKSVLHASNCSINRKPSNAESFTKSIATSSVIGTDSEGSRTIQGPHFDSDDFLRLSSEDNLSALTDLDQAQSNSNLLYMEELRAKLNAIREGKYLKRRTTIYHVLCIERNLFVKSVLMEKKWIEYKEPLLKAYFGPGRIAAIDSTFYKDFLIFLKKYQLRLQSTKLETNIESLPSTIKYNDIGVPAGPFIRSLSTRIGISSSVVDKFQLRNVPNEASQQFEFIISLFLSFINKQKFKKLKDLRKCQHSLPICSSREDILNVLRENQVVIIAGDTGCGKSTQVVF